MSDIQDTLEKAIDHANNLIENPNMTAKFEHSFEYDYIMKIFEEELIKNDVTQRSIDMKNIFGLGTTEKFEVWTAFHKDRINYPDRICYTTSNLSDAEDFKVPDSVDKIIVQVQTIRHMLNNDSTIY